MQRVGSPPIKIARFTPRAFSRSIKSSHFFISISSSAALCSPEEKKKQPLQRKLQRLVTSYMELRILRLEIRLYRSCQSLSNNVLTVFINLSLLISISKQSAVFVGNDFLNLSPHAADL